MANMAKLGLFALAFLASTGAGANGVPPTSLEIQLARADLVAVGRLGRPTSCLVGSRRFPCAEMMMDVSFKGAPAPSGTQRYLILNFGVMELSIEDVRVPARALFFLKRMQFENRDEARGAIEYYRPVSGRQSVLPMADLGSQ